jgi:tetratricopeptide (TPR) repeat protein
MFSQLDSVSLVLAKENNSIKKIDILLEATKTYSNSELSLQFSKQAYSLAIKTDDKIRLAKAANQLSIELYKAELFDSIPYYQDIAIDNFRLKNNVDGLFKVLLKKAKFLKKINKPEKAFDVYKELIDLSEKSESTLMLAEVYENMGLLFSSINDIEKSISYFNKALQMYSKIKDWKGIAKCYLNLGNSNSSKGYTDMAIECFERGLEIDAKYNKLSFYQESALYILIYQITKRLYIFIKKH